MVAQEHSTGEKANVDGAGAEVPVMSEADRRQVRVLTFIVIGLGVLLVAGLALLVATVVMRASGHGGKVAQAVEMTVPVPAGAVVEDMALNGNLLALRLKAADGEREVVVLDVRKGRIMRRVRLLQEGR